MKKTFCYCAHCRSARSVISQQHVSWINVLQSFVLSAALSFLFWQGLHPLSAVFALSFLVLAEIAVRLRRRADLICKKCGFDPVLYKKSPELAKAKVKEFFKKNIMDPDVPLIDSPLIEIRKKIKAKEKILEKQAYFKSTPVLGSSHGKNHGKDPRRHPDV